MADSPNIVARFSDAEKADLLELAARFHSNQTNILRILVHEAVAVLREHEASYQQKKTTRPRAITRRSKSKILS